VVRCGVVMVKSSVVRSKVVGERLAGVMLSIGGFVEKFRVRSVKVVVSELRRLRRVCYKWCPGSGECAISGVRGWLMTTSEASLTTWVP
jgi:hypothetical protein